MFLGISRHNSAYLLGTWRRDTRTRGGYRWVVIENRHARFAETITIKDINDLKPGVEGTYVRFGDVPGIGDFEECADDRIPPMASRGCDDHGLAAATPDGNEDSSRSGDQLLGLPDDVLGLGVLDSSARPLGPGDEHSHHGSPSNTFKRPSPHVDDTDA